MHEYIYIIVPLLSLIMCQTTKFTIESIRSKKLKWGRLFNGSGGMPSTHTSFSFSLVFTVAYNQGISDPLFAIALIFAMIVAYDAMGVRMESGRQAVYINQILDAVFEGKPGTWGRRLKEELGHKPLEVLVGILFALITSLILNTGINFL